MNRDFLKEAIADAKTVKESAIANAKLALEEAFEPQIKSMLAAKLEEMEKEEVKEEAEDKVDEAKKADDEKMEEGKEYMTKKEKREGDDRKFDNKAETETEKMRKLKEDDSELDEILAELETELKEDARTDAEEEGYKDGIKDAKADAKKEIDKIKLEEKDEELKEAYATVETLRKELNEINLLNAKLLYTNKIFKSKNLNETQKVKVLEAFDKAGTVKEAKLVFETVNAGFKSKAKHVNENLGRASKSISTPKAPSKKPIVESDEMVMRFQKLAGIIKG